MENYAYAFSSWWECLVPVFTAPFSIPGYIFGMPFPAASHSKPPQYQTSQHSELQIRPGQAMPGSHKWTLLRLQNLDWNTSKISDDFCFLDLLRIWCIRTDIIGWQLHLLVVHRCFFEVAYKLGRPGSVGERSIMFWSGNFEQATDLFMGHGWQWPQSWTFRTRTGVAFGEPRITCLLWHSHVLFHPK